VMVVEEAEPWSGTRRHGAEEAHSLQAPLVEEPEKVAAVEAPNGAGTPARARRSVQVVAGPRVARLETPEPRVARRGASGAPGARVARSKAPAHVRCDEWHRNRGWCKRRLKRRRRSQSRWCTRRTCCKRKNRNRRLHHRVRKHGLNVRIRSGCGEGGKGEV
jgi:hypothetical protein